MPRHHVPVIKKDGIIVYLDREEGRTGSGGEGRKERGLEITCKPNPETALG